MYEQTIKDLAKRYDSFFIYDESSLAWNVETKQRSYPGITLLYTLKANPFPPLAKLCFEKGVGAVVGSVAEAEQACNAGLPPEMIHYTAPGKSLRHIERTIDFVTIVVDSPSEMLRVQQVAESRGIVASVGIQVNPLFTCEGMDSAPSKFGIDEEMLVDLLPAWKNLPNVRITGLQVQPRQLPLNERTLHACYDSVLSLATHLQTTLRRQLDFLSVGTGLSGPVPLTDPSFSMIALERKLQELREEIRRTMPKTKVFAEVGFTLVNDCGDYVTTVLDKKKSRGKTFVILANTLNGFFRPVLHRTILDAGGICDAVCNGVPVFPAKPFRFVSLGDSTEQETVTLVGNLTSDADTLARDVEMGKLEIGDPVVVPNAGSYGATASPLKLTSAEAPREFMLGTDGNLVSEWIERAPRDRRRRSEDNA